MKCKIVDCFKTTIGEIYILKFDEEKFIPTIKLKLAYNKKGFIITSLFIGSHDYLGSTTQTENVWSCKLRSENNSGFSIPIGSFLDVLQPKLFKF